MCNSPIRRSLLLALGCLFWTPSGPAAAETSAAGEVAALLAGTFDSKEQAEADPDGYRAVRIVAVEVPGSRLGKGAPVLYVEQALAATPDRPYRQRLYRIEEGEGGAIVSRVFEPKDPPALSGKWRAPKEISALGPDGVVEREGCAVTLRKSGPLWEGGTAGNGCLSTLSGATFATSRATVAADRMESWDRGFDASGSQVWGAKEGPYVFRKRSAAPPASP